MINANEFLFLDILRGAYSGTQDQDGDNEHYHRAWRRNFSQDFMLVHDIAEVHAYFDDLKDDKTKGKFTSAQQSQICHSSEMTD